MSETNELPNSPDPTSVIAALDGRIAQQRQALDYEQVFDPFDDIAFPGKRVEFPLEDLQAHLQAVGETSTQFERDIFLAPSTLDRLPLVGRVWQALRRQVHSIALFYTNRALVHEMGVNRQLLQALTHLSAVCQQQQRTLFRLQAEVTALRAQVRE